MFNPLFPFTRDVLEATVERGCTWFVRNNYPQAFDHFETEIKACFLMTHYNDHSKAIAHFNSISNDTSKKLYDWNAATDREKLYIAANQPEGYKIFSAYFLPDYKKKITVNTRAKINSYLRMHTSWKPGKGETVSVDLLLQFGILYASLGYAGEQIKITFKEIEKQR